MSTSAKDWLLLIGFAAVVLCLPLILEPIGANYPDLLQKIAIFGLFAIGFNILFGLTGYLSFGHAAFIGVGSYMAMWSYKLLTMNVLPALIFSTAIAGLLALAIGYVSLRRSGIYFSILTLAFAQMMYNLAYSVLTPLTNGETGLQTRAIRTDPNQSLLDGDLRVIDQALGVQEIGVPTTNFFGMAMSGYTGFYFCAVILILGFFIAQRLTRSNFGMMLKAIKSNQNRLNFTGIHTRPYLIAAFVISGMYAGLAGGLMTATDPIAGAERMQWTASGEVVLMTILGGVGTLVGPVLGAGLIKYAEQKVSSWNEGIIESFFSFLPEGVAHFLAEISALFVGEGWHMTLGLMFMIIVIFLPGGLMEGFRRLSLVFRRPQNHETVKSSTIPTSKPGEPTAPAPAE
ncbi:MAG: branched-chain amino acid ABC transporter permease [Pseudomonadota bacterium]